MQATNNNVMMSGEMEDQVPTSSMEDQVPSSSMETLAADDIEGMLRSLVVTEMEDIIMRIAIQTELIHTASREKGELQHQLTAKKKELESFNPVKPEVVAVTIEDSPNHQEDTVELPDGGEFDFTLLPTLDFTFPTLDFSSLDFSLLDPAIPLASSSPDTSLITQPTPEMIPEQPIPELMPSTPDQTMSPPLVPPLKIKRKKAFMYKCYERGCDLPEEEGTYFCGEHFPSNQLGHPEMHNAYYGITAPIKRKKIYIPQSNPKVKKSNPKSKKSNPKVKKSLNFKTTKYRAIKPKI